jgi:uncharacterized protein (TIGR00369 family)
MSLTRVDVPGDPAEPADAAQSAEPAQSAGTAQPDRQRSYTWSDPAVTATAVATTSGLDILRGVLTGTLPRPPILDTLGIDPVEVEDGRVVFEMTPQEWHYNPIGSVHGGVISTLVDSALGCAVHTRLPAGVGYTSLEIKVNFVRPVTTSTGPIRCEGTVLSLGRRSATAEARVTSAEGKLLAHATTTCMIFPLTP